MIRRRRAFTSQQGALAAGHRRSYEANIVRTGGPSMRNRPLCRLVFAPALLASVLLAGGCSQGPTAPEKTPTSGKAAEEQTPGKVDFTLTSEQLARDYETDRAAADEKYKGKWVEVDGPMESVLVLASGDVNIRLAGFQADPNKLLGHSVRGVPPAADAETLKGLTRGQKVKLKGKVYRETAGSYIDLAPVAIVSVGPDPAIPVTADRLSEDYAKDEKAADARYKDKWLLVEGVVHELKEAKSGADGVVLEGAGMKDGKPLRIAAAYPADRKPDFATLKKGDKVKVKGECGGCFGTVFLSYAVRVK
jgi:hypothetical protein